MGITIKKELISRSDCENVFDTTRRSVSEQPRDTVKERLSQVSKKCY